MTHEDEDNGIKEVSDYVILFKDLSEDVYEVSKTGYILKIAMETLHQVEGSGQYEAMCDAMKKMNTLIPSAEKLLFQKLLNSQLIIKMIRLFILWVQVLLGLQLSNNKFVFLWRCNGLILQ